MHHTDFYAAVRIILDKADRAGEAGDSHGMFVLLQLAAEFIEQAQIAEAEYAKVNEETIREMFNDPSIEY